MGIDSRDVKVNRAVVHVYLPVWQKVGKVLLHDVRGAVIAASKLTQQLTAAIMVTRNHCEF